MPVSFRRPSFVLAAAFALVAVCALASPARAATPATRNFTLLANFNEYYLGPTADAYSACWSYIHGDGREYAILGCNGGTAIYNVTNPNSAYRVGFIIGPTSLWREMKSYRNWIYIVTEGTGSGQGLQIVRMTDPEHPVLAATYTTNFVRSHTVSVDTSRAILICNGTRGGTGLATGMRILSIANPEAPVELTWWPGGAIPVSAGDYIHDCVPIGNRLYASSIYVGNEHVFDFTEPAAPAELKVFTYPGGFTHNSWPDATGKWLYVTDEVNGEPLKIFDISNLTSPVLRNAITSNPQAIVHNAHVKGNELYLSNYTEGIRALDIRDPMHPAEFASADSWPDASGGFWGVWEVCPYFPSGLVIASDMQTGLYLYQPVRDYGLLKASVAYGAVPNDAAKASTGAAATGHACRAMAAHAGGTAASGSCCGGGGAEGAVAATGAGACAGHSSGLSAAEAAAPHACGTSCGGACGASGCGASCAGCGAGCLCGCSAQAAGPATGVKVYLTPQGDSLATASDAVVVFAPSPGTQTMTAKAFGYFDAVATRSVTTGGVDSVALTLNPKPSATFSGVISSAAGGAPLEGAEVTLLYTPIHQHSDAAGQYLIPNVPDDLYRVEVRRPGFVPLVFDRRIGPGYPGADFALTPATFYDNLESPTPWVSGAPGDNASSGLWVRVEPLGTGGPQPAPAGLRGPDPLSRRGDRGGPGFFHEGHETDGATPGDVQPEFDRTPGTGTLCWVTGQGSDPANIGESDVDNGRTTLTSPVLNLSGYVDPIVGYWHWFYSSTPTDPADWLATLVSNNGGTTWIPVDTTRGIHNHWMERAIRVRDFIAVPGTQFRIKFVAADLGAGSVVEAAIDDLELYENGTPTSSVPNGGRLAVRGTYPNPSRDVVRFALSLPREGRLDADVLDVQGRAVRTLHRGGAAAGPLELTWDGNDATGHAAPAGLYFVRARTGGSEVQARFVRIR